jgi:proteasome alpha subunit
MSMPFYVSPEQMTQDKAEFARKGIARGRSLVTLEFVDGILLVAENPLNLSKIGEIYDRIAFAGVGKYSEFDRLRQMGIQYADIQGFRFSREDVRAKALANLYSQTIGDEFNRSIKPLEVEIVVAEVGDPESPNHASTAIYNVNFDGRIIELEGHAVIGGANATVKRHVEANYQGLMPLGDALRLGRDALQRAENGNSDLPPDSLEVCLLDRNRPGRKFRRLSADEVRVTLDR